ncbi:MAG: hypothetical protein HOK80_10440 [Candidatus Cloacimonetes bacterium]|jgi:hypothetical protein|nr:hypothetical protein [Candidatus Cloacimonadota bacterium]
MNIITSCKKISKQERCIQFTASVWKTYPHEYRLQTDDPLIAKKLSRRMRWHKVSDSPNSDHWIYTSSFKRSKKAVEVLEALTDTKAVKDGDFWEVKYSRDTKYPIKNNNGSMPHSNSKSVSVLHPYSGDEVVLEGENEL